MTTLLEAHKHDACYFGDRPEWAIILCRNRDSDILEQSNFESALEALGGESATVAIERSSHWAVGWVEYLVIDPSDAERLKLGQELRDSLEDYPVLDEEDYSRREWEEYRESWDSWGRSDFVKAACVAITAQYPGGIDGDFGDEEVLDAIRELDPEVIDAAVEKARQSVNWEYQSEGSGVTINIKGLVEKCDTSALIDPAVEALWEQRKADDIRKLGRALGACPAELTLAVKQGINTVSGYLQLMQGSI